MKEHFEKKKIFIVIPAYNEGKRIEAVLKEIRKWTKNIIVVDDCSKDNTYEIAKKYAHTIKLITNMGAGLATRVAADIAFDKGADIVVTIDADGQHAPSDIEKIIQPFYTEDIDIVFGSRPRNKEMPLIKRIGNTGLSTIARILFNVNIKDSQSGFHAFTKEAYQKLRWTSARYGVVSEFVARTALNNLKFKEVEVQTIYNDKEVGMGKKDAIKSVMSMVKWRLKR